MKICARAIALCLAAHSPLFAHAISMSSGFATVAGNRVEYILRMPSYEITSLRNPQQALFDHIRFRSGFETGQRADSECHSDPQSSSYVCAANYVFSQPVERLSVECSFYEVTVANHIHVLRAERAGKVDRAILDASVPSAVLAFRPPTAFENAVEQFMAGAIRAWTSVIQTILLIAIALAARTRRELGVLCIAYLAAEVTLSLFLRHSAWQPSLRFAESVAALTLAYLAFEMTVFPAARGRWIPVLALGAFAGLYFGTFLTDSRYPPGFVLGGAGLVSLTLIVVFSFAVLVLDRFRLRRAACALLLIAGCAWFFVAAQLLPSIPRLN